MLKTKCFIVGGMFLSSSLQAALPYYEKPEQAEEYKRLEERNKIKLKLYEVEEANELQRKVERHDEEIKELKRELERLDNKIDSIRGTIILNAPLPEMHPPVLLR